MKTKSILRAILLLLAFAVLAYLYSRTETIPTGSEPRPPAGRATDSRSATGGDRAIADAFEEKRSGVMVQSSGVVEKLLADDLEGSRHQRFIVRLDTDHTLLVSHNIDIAERIPLAERDSVEFRGQYEWNERGGVVHWTHHDPAGRHPGGWIRHAGEQYE